MMMLMMMPCCPVPSTSSNGCFSAKSDYTHWILVVGVWKLSKNLIVAFLEGLEKPVRLQFVNQERRRMTVPAV